jgi:RimJ/RimL family protein N-acetyltransferase
LEEKEGGAFIGFAGLAHQEDWTEDRHKTEAGWRLDRAFWGRGLATEAAKASVTYGLETLGLERIISIIQPGNTASRRGEGRAHPARRDPLEGHARRLVRDRPIDRPET